MTDIKECFVSRFGERGRIMEVDYSQLEIVVLAEVTQDPQLLADIRAGTDMHRVRAAELFGIPEVSVTKQQRTTAKMLSFQLQYGAGANSMAKDLGIQVKLAQQFVINYYKRYPAVKRWQDNMIKAIHMVRYMPTDPARTKAGNPKGVSKFNSPTGRIYTFSEYDAPDWVKEVTSFSPTEIKNYPIQGYATGDIVPFILGLVRRRIYAAGLEDVCLLVNTVHDSIVLDIEEEYVYTIGKLMKDTMEHVPAVLDKMFGIKCTLPFPVEVSFGVSWDEQTTIESFK